MMNKELETERFYPEETLVEKVQGGVRVVGVCDPPFKGMEAGV